MSRELNEEQRMQLNLAIFADQQRLRSCKICTMPTRGRGAFIPDDPTEFNLGKPEGDRTRLVIYGLCDHCQKDKRNADLIEAQLADKGSGIKFRNVLEHVAELAPELLKDSN